MNPIRIDQFARLDNDWVIMFSTMWVEETELWVTEYWPSSGYDPMGSEDYRWYVQKFATKDQYPTIQDMHANAILSVDLGGHSIESLGRALLIYPSGPVFEDSRD